MTCAEVEQETCGKGHPRTPETTYVNPSGKRQCRVCSGKMLAGSKSDSLTAAGRRGEHLTPAQLQRLRESVKCMGCGAVPQETGETREVTDGHGNDVTLPWVTTTHAPGCPVAAQAPRKGRPRRKTMDSAQRPAGTCQTCGEIVTSFAGRPKLYCDSSCRSTAKRHRQRARELAGRPPVLCAVASCGATVPQSTRAPRKYCSVKCRVKANAAIRKAARSGART